MKYWWSLPSESAKTPKEDYREQRYPGSKWSWGSWGIWGAIPGSNFKSLFTSMVSRRQDLRQVGIDEFLRALRSLGIKKDDLSGETLKFKYTKDAPYKTHHHSTYAPNITKKSSSSAQSLSQGGKGYGQKPPGLTLTFSMFINLLIKLSLNILFHFIISFWSTKLTF